MRVGGHMFWNRLYRDVELDIRSWDMMSALKSTRFLKNNVPWGSERKAWGEFTFVEDIAGQERTQGSPRGPSPPVCRTSGDWLIASMKIIAPPFL